MAHCLLKGYAGWIRLGPTPPPLRTGFYCRAPRIWNTLPAHLWNTDCSVAHFKKDLINYYLYLTKSVYDMALVSHWTACSIICVVDFLSMSSQFCFYISVFFFCRILKIVLLVSFITNFPVFFLDLEVELALWVIQASCRSLKINKCDELLTTSPDLSVSSI